MTKHLDEDDILYIYYLLRTNKLIDKIWPVYSWDTDDPVYGLMVDDDRALELLADVTRIRFTKQQITSVLRRYGVVSFGTPFSKLPEEKLLDQFYRKRKDRKILT